MITFSIYIPEELNEKIEHLASLNGCSKNKQCIHLLERLLDNDKWYEEQVTEIVLFNARTGRIVS